MPIKKGSSQNTISKNIDELMKKPSKTRAKAVNTLAKKLGITSKEARRRQAVAIALSTAGKPLSKTNK
jgi:hypothetical protein|tara:strand:+ start:714 stop:917 length:204 start_codon:yes stop_codon:yes gene_type:complete